MRNGFLPPVFDADEIREPPHHGDIPVGFKLPGGISAVQSIGERIRLGLQGDDFPIELPLPGKSLIKPLLTVLEGCSGCVKCRSPVVIGVLALLFQLSDARARLLRLCPHIGQLCGQVGDSGVRRMHRRFLASDQFPQIGDMRVALFRGFAQFGQGLAHRGETPFMVGACFGRLIIGEPRIIDRTPLLGYLPLKFVGTFGEHVGVFAGIGHNLRADGSGAFGGHRSKRAESFLKTRQIVPHLIRLGELRVRSRGDGLHLFDAHFGFCQVLLQRGELAAGVGEIAAQMVTLISQLACVIGEQPGLGVPDGHLDGVCTPGNARLTPQRAELAVDFAQQIVKTGEIVFGVRQLSQRPFFAFAVLENAGGLFDERAMSARVSAQNGVKPALPDNHMHLLAEAGIRQEFLDVQQPARRPVDCIFRAAVAVQRTADGHFRIVDVERVIGVVDGQGDLRAPRRRPGGGARENHVLHRRAAKVFGALFAHHPSQGVNDVGFA